MMPRSGMKSIGEGGLHSAVLRKNGKTYNREALKRFDGLSKSVCCLYVRGRCHYCKILVRVLRKGP